MEEIIIIGAGGHAKVVADLILKTGNKLLGFLDDLSNVDQIFGFKILGNISKCLEYKDKKFIIAIGNNYIRKKISAEYDLKYISLIHPSACIGLGVSIDEGTAVLANCVINSGAKIGKHCIINTASIIEHDNLVENFAHVSPNACLGGNVQIGECTHIGIGATLKNNISICKDCIIGAGAVVIKNIDESGVYVNIPAKKIKDFFN